ncbi:MAG: glycosyltransferase family 4 protein [Alteromonadaceae bacterium]|nr:glycosyltransferase family 4 protein [Alteromonadaceae bacterium]
MKIIHILKGKANPNTMNGVNKVVHNLATEQQLLGYDVEVWGITATPDNIKHTHDYTLRLFSATKLRFLLSPLLLNALKSLANDNVVVHLHSVFLPELFSVSQQLKKNSTPWVLSPHSGYNPNSMKKNKWLKFLYMNLFEKKLISGATKVHAIGSSEINDIENLVSDVDVVLIPNGQSLDDVNSTDIPCDKIIERPIFGFCGRLAKEHKGLDLLIDGFLQYKAKGGKGELWLIGDGPDKQELFTKSDMSGHSESIKFLGKMFGNDKFATLKQMDVFVHTSRWEGMPIAVLEAFALGKPVLISEATNMASYVKSNKNGIVLTENNSKIIEKSMFELFELFETNELEDIGKNSIKVINEYLNWPKIVKSMITDLYH